MAIEQKIFITTDALIFLKEKNHFFLLLIKRKNQPYKDHWALPGGFADDDELVVNACKRELKEEAGLDLEVNNFDFLNYYDAISRDSRSRTITFAFIAQLSKRISVKGNDDAAEARWFDIKNLPILAFDHAEIIKDALISIE